MLAKSLYGVLLVGCLALSSALAQITVPAQTAAYKPVVATLAATLPPGAQLRGSWSVTGGDFLEVDANTVHVWAAPGVHTISASGVWVLTKSVTIEGQNVPILIDFGQYAYTTQFTIAAVGPPVPPPAPPGNRWALIVEETSIRTPQQAALWLQLRKAFGQRKLLILDQDNPSAAWGPFFAHAAGVARPALVVFAGDGAFVRAVPCPATVAAVQAEVAK